MTGIENQPGTIKDVVEIILHCQVESMAVTVDTTRNQWDRRAPVMIHLPAGR